MAETRNFDWEKVAEGFLGVEYALGRSSRRALRKEFLDNFTSTAQEEAGKGFDKVWAKWWKKRRVEIAWAGDQLWLHRLDHKGQYDAMTVEFSEIQRLVEDWLGKEEE